MQLDTENTIYIGLDGSNAEVKVLVPRNLKVEIVELNLADRDPESTDAAEFKLLETEMNKTTYEI